MIVAVVGDEVVDRLNGLRGASVVIIGIGNELKGDDGVGPFLCHQLKGRVAAKLIDAGTVPENYIQPIIKAKPEKLLVVDAMEFGGEAGEVRIFEVGDISSVVMSTHSLSPRLFVDLIGREIEVEVLFLGIQPEQTRLGGGLSPEVESVGGELARVLVDALSISG